MALQPDEQGSGRPRLKLEHDVGLPDARQTGHILDRLANAYRGYSRLGFQNPDFAADLLIEHMSAGSLYVVFRDALETAAAIITIYEHRELMGGFITQLNEALSTMRNMRGSPLPMYRTAIEALSAPVRASRATTVTLTVIGDNNRIFIIDSASAKDIQQYMNTKPRPTVRVVPQ